MFKSFRKSPNHVAYFTLLTISLSFIYTPAVAASNFDYTTFTLSNLNDTYDTPICMGARCFTKHGNMGLIISKSSKSDFFGVELRNRSITNAAGDDTLNTAAFNGFFGSKGSIGKRFDIYGGLKFGASGNLEYCDGQTISCTDTMHLDLGANIGLSVWFDSSKIFAGHFKWSRDYINSSSEFGQIESTNSKIGISCYLTESHELSALYSSNRLKTTNPASAVSFNSLTGIEVSYSFHFDK